LILNYSLNYITLTEGDICLSDAANPGDPGIMISGVLKNEYDKDYWICLSAGAYDSDEKFLGGSTDSGPVCGIISRYIERNKTENFELHLKYNNTISKINLGLGCIMDIPPP
jgi:hypothetical protein